MDNSRLLLSFLPSIHRVGCSSVCLAHGEDKHQRELSDALNAVRMPFWDAVLGGQD